MNSIKSSLSTCIDICPNDILNVFPDKIVLHKKYKIASIINSKSGDYLVEYNNENENIVIGKIRKINDRFIAYGFTTQYGCFFHKLYYKVHVHINLHEVGNSKTKIDMTAKVYPKFFNFLFFYHALDAFFIKKKMKRVIDFLISSARIDSLS